jgi:tetratricopeptide (TPR) repeat protein
MTGLLVNYAASLAWWRWSGVWLFLVLLILSPFADHIWDWTCPALSVVLMAVLILSGIVRILSARNSRFENRALRLHQQGKTAEAASLLTDAIQQHGPTAERCSTLAFLWASQQQWQEALAWDERAEQLSGGFPPYLVNKAVTLWKLGRSLEALDCFREAERRDSENVIGLCQQGTLLVELNRLDEALQVLRTAERFVARRGKAGDKALAQEMENIALLRTSLKERGVV